MQLNKSLPYLAGLVIFYLVVAVFFKEIAFENKSLPQHDLMQYEGMSKWPLDHLKKTNERPLWNSGMFSGMPSYMVSFGPDNWPVYSLRRLASNLFFNYPVPSLLLINMICCWILLLSFKVKPKIAIIGALVYAFNTYLIVTIEAGHFTKILAIAFGGLIIAGLKYVFTGRYIWGIPLLCTALAIELMVDHLQITYYYIFVCAAFGISELYFRLKEKQSKQMIYAAVIILGACLLALGSMTSKLWLVKEYASYSIRGERLLTPDNEESKPKNGLSREYAFNWSQGKLESLTLLVPYFNGGGSSERLSKGTDVYKLFEKVAGKQRTEQLIKTNQVRIPMYFGDQPFTSGPIYAGAITCFLFILGLLIVENRTRFWVLSGAILTMLIAWGSNFAWFNYFLFDYLPFFNKFRSPSMALSLTVLLMNMLGFVALNQITDLKMTSDVKRKLMISSGITLGLLVLILLYSFVGDFSTEKDLRYGQQIFGQQGDIANQFALALENDRASAIRFDAFKSILLVVVSLGLIWAYLNQSLTKLWLILGIGVLAFGDMWIVAKRYLYKEKFERQAQKTHVKTAADEMILQDKDPHYRVFNLREGLQGGASTSYFHKSIGGYHAAKMRRYQDLIEHQLTPESQELIGSIQSRSLDFSNLHVFNMLNTKYFKFGDSKAEVIPNPYALGNVWFVDSLVNASSPDEEMKALGEINTKNKAVVNLNEFKLSQSVFDTDSLASIQLIEESPRKMSYKSTSSKEGFAVFSEIYYPAGWEAFIDGNPVEIVRVNYALRGLLIPEGEHNIEFTFNPDGFIVGGTIAKVSGYLFALIVFGGFGFAIFKSVTSKSEEEENETNTSESVVNESTDVTDETKNKSQSHSSKSNRKPRTKRKKR